MKRINSEVLKPGDIILTTSTAKVSKAIRRVTRSNISHAMVCVEGYSVIDATAEGVQARNTQRLFYEDGCSVHILRWRGGLSGAQLHTILMFMRSHIGTRYSVKEAVQTAFGGYRRATKKQFCSRLVAQAFSSASIQLVEDSAFCTPAELQESPYLEVLVEPTVAISAEEKAQWDDVEDATQTMRNALNVILSGARKKNGDIETFEDIHTHLARHPEDDDAFCILLHQSNYLNLWRANVEKNPWQYDLALMSADPADQMAPYCLSTVADEENGPNRYIVNRGAYQLYSRQSDLRFFHMMADLYETLAAWHHRRVKVAASWLELNGYPVPGKKPHLVPHTPEWFVSLQDWDPPKAMMTRHIIQTEGRVSVCSICGDDPANDFILEATHQPLGGPHTLRLCDDCFEIRTASGEAYLPLA